MECLIGRGNPADRFLIQSAFRESAMLCEWRVIEHGAEAMRTVCTTSPTFQPDLILLDWQLPGATGLEVLTTLKQSRQWASIPVIMFTGIGHR